jgi:phage terminase small subunit
MSEIKLTPKQELFIQYYLEDLNSTQAAIRAGYSKKTATEMGYENLSKPQVSERIKQELDRLKKKSQVTKESMIEELRRIAFGNMGNLANWNESGVRYKASDELTPEAMSTTKPPPSVKAPPLITPKTEDSLVKVVVSVKTPDSC